MLSSLIIIINNIMDSKELAADEVCANCGKAAVDEIKLKKCACNLVKYCSVECQKNHRPQHKKACKKRMAEIRDDRLFTQPDGSHLGECPICCLPLPLPLPLHRSKSAASAINSCCCKEICDGCSHANQLREIEQGLEQRCPFCREPMPIGDKQDEEFEKNYMKRVKVNDPVALYQMGGRYHDKGDYGAAFEYSKKAAELGYVAAHFNLAFMYHEGKGVEKDIKNAVYHWEEAAIGGHPRKVQPWKSGGEKGQV